MVLVLVLALVPVPDLDFSILEALFPKKLASNYGFLTFVLHFRLDPGGPNPVLECITVSVPLRQKR